jgi:ABC-type sugar transport system substrate-binding protein
MKNFRRILSIVLSLVMAASLTAVAVAESQPLQVYAVSVMSGGAAWGQYEVGFNKACEELGYEGHYLAPQSFNSATELVNLTETAITNGANMILPVVVDAEAFADVLVRAKEAGIVLVGIQAPDDHLDAYIGTDPINLGNAMAEALVASVGDGPIKVATMQTLLTAGIQQVQCDAFVAKLAELRPDAVVVDRLECNSNAATAADKISALYLANPDCNAMVALDSYAGLGAASFVEEKGLQGQFHVIGIDDAAEILMCIKNKTMDCTVAHMWYDMGYKSVYLAKAIHDGEAFEYANDSGSSIVFAQDVDAWAAANGITLAE